MQDLALLVTLILLGLTAIGFCAGALIATKTRTFLIRERIFLSVAWASPILLLTLWNTVLAMWALGGYIIGTLIFWRKWL